MRSYSDEIDLLDEENETLRAKLAEADASREDWANMAERHLALFQEANNKVVRMREALELAQWTVRGSWFECPICYREQSEGHTDTCKLDKALSGDPAPGDPAPNPKDAVVEAARFILSDKVTERFMQGSGKIPWFGGLRYSLRKIKEALEALDE